MGSYLSRVISDPWASVYVVLLSSFSQLLVPCVSKKWIPESRVSVPVSVRVKLSIVRVVDGSVEGEGVVRWDVVLCKGRKVIFVC